MTEKRIRKPVIKFCELCNRLRKVTASLCKECHFEIKSIKDHLESPIIECACGCGIEFHSINRSGKNVKYIWNHHKRGKKVSEEIKKKYKMAMRHFPNNYHSSIEKIVGGELNKLGILYIKHYPTKIRDFMHPADVFIPPNIIIEIDGEYFHTRLIDKRKQKIDNIQLDYIIDAELENKGYRVYRFWETDVNQNLQWVINQISKIIGRNPIKITDRIICKCGCGGELKPYDNKGRKRKYLLNHINKRHDYGARTCVDCKTNETPSVKLKSGRLQEQWRKAIEGGYLCLKCYDKRRYTRPNIKILPIIY